MPPHAGILVWLAELAQATFTDVLINICSQILPPKVGRHFIKDLLGFYVFSQLGYMDEGKEHGSQLGRGNHLRLLAMFGK